MPRGSYPKTKEHKKKLSLSLKGRKAPWNTKRCKGIPLSKKHKKRISLSKVGVIRSEETKRKISEGHKGLLVGKRNPQWKGGISFEPYSVDWTKTLKRSIRERDKYQCKLCGKEPALDCHHIDYNKTNCNPNNLIILCRSCHIKTNTNREYWKMFFL